MHISTGQITSKKARENNIDSSTIETTSKEVRGNNVDFSTTEITSKKVRGNNMDFSTSKITSKKVRGKDVDFSISKVTLKKYAEMTWKFVKIWSSTFLRDIDVESTWIRRGVPVRKAYSKPCHRILFSHIQAYSEPCATLAYAEIPQWTFWYCNDIGVTSPSISLWLCWYIVNETHDNVNLRYQSDIRVLRLNQSDFNVVMTSSR